MDSLPPLLPARVAVFFHFMLEGYFNALWSVYLPVQQFDLGLSDSLVGAASLFNYGGQVVATLIAALLLQRIGARASCLTGALMFCSSMYLIPLSHSFAALCMTFLLFGSTEGIMDVSMNACAVLTETVAARPLLGTYHGSYSIAAALGGLIGGAFLDRQWDEQATYLVSASVGICLALLSFLQLYSLEQEQLITVDVPATPDHPLSRTHSYSSVDVEKARETDQDNHLVLETPTQPSSPSPFLSFLNRRPLFVLSFVGFLASFGEGAVVTWVTIWFTRSFSSAPGGLYSLGFTCFMSCMALGRFACDYLRQFVGRRQMVTVSGLLASGGVTLVAFAPSMVAEPASVYVACLGCAVTGLGLSTLIPTVFSSAGHLPGEHAGTAISRVAFWTYAGSIVSPPLIGALSDAFQSLQLGFIILAVLLFFLFPLGRLVPPESRHPEAARTTTPAGKEEGADLKTPLLVKSDEPSTATPSSGGSTWSAIGWEAALDCALRFTRKWPRLRPRSWAASSPQMGCALL
jgi:MFS family permease